MQKIAINSGGDHFCLTEEMDKWLVENKIFESPEFSDLPETMVEYIQANNRIYIHIDRSNPLLHECIEEFGDNRHCKFKIVEIPEDVDWQIEDYFGDEWVAETHRTWR